jgi:hypothetical protein
MNKTHFGFESVDEDQKAQRVRGVFDSVAPKYDLMNDVMSGGLHRAWKAYTWMVANLKPGQRALDIAGGTGDLALACAGQVGVGGGIGRLALECRGGGGGGHGDRGSRCSIQHARRITGRVAGRTGGRAHHPFG